jgi:NH3-dependent NAD+ synthetase
MSTTENQSTTDYHAMAEYLEHLLTRQTDRLRSYDIDGACAVADETTRVAEELTQRQILNQPQFAEHRRRLQQQYKDICLIISDQREEVAGKLQQIRKSITALSGYSGK